MSFKTILYIIVCFLLCEVGYAQEKGNPTLNYHVHTFYYGWFGSADYDGRYNNWNHQVIPHWRDTTWDNAEPYPGGDDIGANYFPALGAYSSNDPEIIKQHMAMIRDAGIGVLAISWWGKDHFTDKSLKTYLDLAERYDLKLAFHIEPVYKSASEFKALMEYLADRYLDHPAVFKHKGKPLHYIYDSGKVKYHEWSKLLSKDGELSLRNTKLDAIFIGHWERERDGGFITKSGFDGFYTYYASEGFMWGCASENWPVMAKFAKENDLIFIPCPGPGYIDTRIRPWNTRNTEDRKHGKYYKKMFMNAVNVSPEFIGITSFNEWHEGTQIEPAIPKTIPGYTYEDYGKGIDPMYYMKLTKELVEKYSK